MEGYVAFCGGRGIFKKDLVFYYKTERTRRMKIVEDNKGVDQSTEEIVNDRVFRLVKECRVWNTEIQGIPTMKKINFTIQRLNVSALSAHDYVGATLSVRLCVRPPFQDPSLTATMFSQHGYANRDSYTESCFAVKDIDFSGPLVRSARRPVNKTNFRWQQRRSGRNKQLELTKVVQQVLQLLHSYRDLIDHHMVPHTLTSLKSLSITPMSDLVQRFLGSTSVTRPLHGKPMTFKAYMYIEDVEERQEVDNSDVGQDLQRWSVSTEKKCLKHYVNVLNGYLNKHEETSIKTNKGNTKVNPITTLNKNTSAKNNHKTINKKKKKVTFDDVPKYQSPKEKVKKPEKETKAKKPSVFSRFKNFVQRLCC